MVFTGVIADALKETLNTIVDDSTDGYDRKAVLHQYCDEPDMHDHYEDDLEMGGPGLASEKAEGAEMATGTIREGYITRYIARTFGLKMLITQEAMEDNKYPKVINAGRRLKRSGWKTADIDAANMLVRAFNSAYVGGDGQPLCSSAHTLPNGGTFSNVLATPMSPSRASFIIARSMVMKFPGHDGTIEGADIKAVIHPVEQWAVWEGLVKSSKAPEPGSFNEINVAYTHDFKLIPVKYWTNTATNYIFQTDVDNGLQFRWRRKFKSNSWVENSQEVMLHSLTARWARGWTDPRCVLGVQA
jgi:hypothetical protein